MVTVKSSVSTLFTLLALTGVANAEQTSSPSNSNDIVEPVLQRQAATLDMHSRDWEIGVFGGLATIDSDGVSAPSTTHAAIGVRGAYHFTDNIFIEGSYSVTGHSQQVTFINGVLGYNFHQDTFITRDYGMKTSLFFVAGAGLTDYENYVENKTLVGGAGYRVVLNDAFSVRIDLRGHLHKQHGGGDFSISPEATLGLAFSF
ncbi:hypothetical protein QWY77_07855 [Thalassotalea ponticola]|uniref:hypothetical protein n=1 Tax=Thalassotalea ponticola TaxID=1523392 RepID=UPI0025B2E715|nr:hypothetical protein [Thalassotalea ponticola]MDN3652676.1 hypothetical protein [Thalassotalea ponticola]